MARVGKWVKCCDRRNKSSIYIKWFICLKGEKLHQSETWQASPVWNIKRFICLKGEKLHLFERWQASSVWKVKRFNNLKYDKLHLSPGDFAFLPWILIHLNFSNLFPINLHFLPCINRINYSFFHYLNVLMNSHQRKEEAWTGGSRVVTLK